MRVKCNFNFFVLGTAATAFLLWAFVLWRKYQFFGYCDWDLALFSQGMWSLIHADGYSSIFERHILSNHANLIALIILPVYFVVQHPLTLVFLKVVSYILAGVGLFYLSKPRVGRVYALWLMGLYYFYVPNVFGLLHDFDFESLSPAFLVGLLYFFEKRRWWPFMITAMLLMTIKENMPLVVFAFGLYGLLSLKDRIAWGVVPMALSVTMFLILVKIFIPLMSTGHLSAPLPYAGNYAYLWQDGWWAGVAHVGKTFFQPANTHLMQEWFGPLCYVPLFGLKALFFVAPLFMQHFMSTSKTEHMIIFYYGMALAPFIFLSMAMSLEHLKKVLSSRAFFYLVALITLVFFQHWSGCLPKFFQRMSCSYSGCAVSKNTLKEKWSLLRRIPDKAPVAASFSFLTPLSQRFEVYPFYKLYSDRFQHGENPWRLPAHVAYAIIDFDDPWMRAELPDPESRSLDAVMRRLGGSSWEIVGSSGQTVLFRKVAQGGGV